MIEGINLLISIFIGCIVFIYYTNALFKPRTKYLYANISIIVGYMMLYAISSFYQPTLNVIAFSIATFVLMYLCFKVTLKNAIIQAFMLTAIMFKCANNPCGVIKTHIFFRYNYCKTCCKRKVKI